jgi:hypothetical protein
VRPHLTPGGEVVDLLGVISDRERRDSHADLTNFPRKKTSGGTPPRQPKGIRHYIRKDEEIVAVPDVQGPLPVEEWETDFVAPGVRVAGGSCAG